MVVVNRMDGQNIYSEKCMFVVRHVDMYVCSMLRMYSVTTIVSCESIVDLLKSGFIFDGLSWRPSWT